MQIQYKSTTTKPCQRHPGKGKYDVNFKKEKKKKISMPAE